MASCRHGNCLVSFKLAERQQKLVEVCRLWQTDEREHYRKRFGDSTCE